MKWTVTGGLAVVGMLALVGCEPSEPVAPETPKLAPMADTQAAVPAAPAGTGQLPPNHPPVEGLPPNHPPMGGRAGRAAAPPAAAMPAPGDTGTGETIEAPTKFAGITLTPPANWQAKKPARGAGGIAGPVAIFVLPAAEGETDPTTARLTHFPGMRNVPLEMNLQRWYRTLAQPDGRNTADVAEVETFEVGGTKVTMVDFTGRLASGGGDMPMRMVAAEIAHPNGPHYLKILGPEKSMAANRESIEQYLRSAAVSK